MRLDSSEAATAALSGPAFRLRTAFAARSRGVRACAVAMLSILGTSASYAVQYGNCHWDGKAPVCNGSCSDGFVQVKTASCVVGHKAYCCETLGSTTSDGGGQAYKPTHPLYVAVAGDEKGHWTVSAGYPNKQSATAAALNGCGSGCKLLYERQAICVAVSAAPEGTPWGITSSDDLGRAQNKAQQACADQAPGRCLSVQSKCGGS